MDGSEDRKGGNMSTEELKKELDQMADEIIEKEGIGKVKETAAYKDLVAAIDETQRHMEEQRTRDQPRRMMGVEDVMAALDVSRSHSYQIIRRLNQELEKAGYITVRGKISRAYFEERTYGVSVDAG